MSSPKTGIASTTSTASDASPKAHGRRQISPAQRAKTVFPVDDPEWRKWMNQHFYVRQGVSFQEMNEAQRAAAFGMKIVAFDPYVPKERGRELGVELVPTLEALLVQADVVTIHLPKTPDTEGLLGEREIALMKPGARLVNTSRGGLVDEAALAKAIEDGRLAGAALDVFATEPPGDSPLLRLDEVVATPHLGASTSEAQDKAGTTVAEMVRLALLGEFVPFAVNLATGEVSETVRPFVPLAARLGRILVGLADGALRSIECRYEGRIAEGDVGVLTLAILKGAISGVVDEPVSFVRRSGRMSEAQERAFSDLAPRYLLDVPRAVAWTSVHPEARFDVAAEYGREADLFVEIGSPENVESYLAGMVERRERIPGFGHRIYHVKDPRSSVIQRLAGEVIVRPEEQNYYAIALEVEARLAERLGARGLWPNVDLFSGCVFHALDIPIDFFTPVFAASRTLGWAVQMREQLESGNRLFRPTQLWNGSQPRPLAK